MEQHGFADCRVEPLLGGLMAINSARVPSERGIPGTANVMLRQMEVSEVRRRLRGVVEQAKRHAAERRARNDDASRAYDTFLAEVAIPAFHTVAQALTGEGYRFKVFTPGAVRQTLAGILAGRVHRARARHRPEMPRL